MKTTEQVWTEIRRLAEKELNNGKSGFDDSINILLDWGRELCEEQRYKCQYDYDKRTSDSQGKK